MYASRRSPKLLPDEIKNYEAKRSWQGVFDTCIEKEGGDGHVSKMARALAHGERLCKPFEDRENFKLKGDMWLKLGNMREYLFVFPQNVLFLSPMLMYVPGLLVCDSTINSPNDKEIWVRSAGFDEAWKDTVDRAKL